MIGFNILDGSKYSDFSKLRNLLDTKKSLLRSSHVGNFDCITTFLAKSGFKILLHEYLHQSVNVYSPTYIKKRGYLKKIIENKDNNKLALYFSTNSQKNLLHYHYRQLKKKYSNTILLSDFYLTGEVFLRSLLNIWVKEYPSIFYTFVDSTGDKFFYDKFNNTGQFYINQSGKKIFIKYKNITNTIINFLKETSISIKTGKPFKSCGFVIGTEMNIILSTLLDLSYKQNTIHSEISAYHISGLKMFNYLTKENNTMSHKINFLYNLLFRENKNIPHIINFYIIPTDNIRDNLIVVNNKKQIICECKEVNLFKDNVFTQYDDIENKYKITLKN